MADCVAMPSTSCYAVPCFAAAAISNITRQQPWRQLCAYSAASGVWASWAEGMAAVTEVGTGVAFSGGSQRGQVDWMAAGAEREVGATAAAAAAEREVGATAAAAGATAATGSRAPRCLRRCARRTALRRDGKGLLTGRLRACMQGLQWRHASGCCWLAEPHDTTLVPNGWVCLLTCAMGQHEVRLTRCAPRAPAPRLHA